VSGWEKIAERWLCGGTDEPGSPLAVVGPVCAVLMRDPVVGLKAYIGGSGSSWRVANHGARLDEQLARVLFPGHDSEKWADY
jgi:hypothetical protein